MDSMLQTQAKLRQELGLSRVPLMLNEQYKPNGIKSYASLMRKLRFEPTQPGPYVFMNKMRQRGLANMGIAVGGRAHMEKVLVRRLEEWSGNDGIGSNVVEVTIDDLQNDALYLCEVDVGAQKLKLELDTSATELWVHAVAPAKPGPSGHGHSGGTFAPERSSTFKTAPDRMWRRDFGAGSSASGEVGTDNVIIGGLLVKDQPVHLATTLDRALSKHRPAADGCLGLGLDLGADTDAQPSSFMANMASGGELPKYVQLFTTALYNHRGPKQHGSFCTFAYIDQDMIKASGREISWVDVAADSSRNNRGMWMIPCEFVGVNDRKIAAEEPQAVSMAAVDIGTPLVVVSDAACLALYAKIKGARYSFAHQGYLIPKSTDLGSLPRFGIAVGDGGGGQQIVVIPSEELVFAEADADYWYGSVQSRGENTFDVLGHPFLRSVYAIWDQGNRRFGYVPMKEAS